MYGDSDVLRRRVDHLREQAVDVRALADQLVAQTESTGWTGRAAESMRVRVTERATHLRAAAAQHEAAADALDQHVHDVDEQRDAIADVERRALSLIAEARTRVSRLQQAAVDRNAELGRPVVVQDPDPDDLVLVAFEAPPAGHVDWLAVELPGL